MQESDPTRVDTMTVMIDWLTGTIETPTPLCTGYNAGYKILIDQHGQIIREEKSLLNVHDETPSFSRNFNVCTPTPQILRISGNPSKLLQGHNLFGSDDINGCFVESGDFLLKCADLFPSPENYEALRYSKPQYSRIDLTRSFRFSDPRDVPIYIREIVGTARTRSGRAKLYGSETAYFNIGSRRWGLKVYDKHAEFIKRLGKNPNRLDPRIEELIEWSRGIVRFELVLRGLELGDINAYLMHGKVVNFDEVFNDYFGRIQFNENLLMKKNESSKESNLKPNLRGVIALWREGKDLRTLYKKPTFYRHRQAILTAVGIDIASSPNDSHASKRVGTVQKQDIFDTKMVRVEPDGQFSSKLDPSGWDPEPIEPYFVKPRESLKKAYKLP